MIQLLQSLFARLRPPISAGAAGQIPERKAMFRISEIFGKVVTTFEDAAAAIEADAKAIYDKLPAEFQGMIQADVSTAKQYVSDAIGQVDSALAARQQAIALAVEQAADTELGVLTGGASVEFNAFTNAGIDQIVSAGEAAFHNWALSVKGRLAAPAAPEKPA